MRKLLSVATLAALAAGMTWWWLQSGRTPDIRELADASLVPLGEVSTRVISQGSLPPEGTRSLFDHLLAQNDGLPWPFESLVELVQQQAPHDAPPRAVMIPLGRSLLKGRADFAEPRIVVAADYQAANTPASLGVLPRGQLFLGFTEAADEIEVISYNELAGRFEFQLVQNYCAGCVPRIVYAQRAVCLACHQGGSPIFSVRPWQETNGQPEIASRIVEARGDAPYLGVEPVQPVSAPERIDELTDVGNFINVAQRVWLDGCGDPGAACRRVLLREALRFLDDPARLSGDAPGARELLSLQAASWPQGGIGIPDNDLHNRDPLAEADDLRSRLRAWLSSADRITTLVRDNSDLDAFAQLPALPAALDPLTPRGDKQVLGAQSLDGVPALARMLGPGDHASLRQAANGRWETVLDAVTQLDDTLFDARPFTRVALVGALLQQLGADAPGYCCLSTDEMSEPVAAGEPPLSIPTGSVLEPFEAFCFACHRGNPAQRLNFMSGDSEQAVLEHLRDTPSVRDALDWTRYQGTGQEAKLMPPADSAQRTMIEQAIERDPELLERMREVVPAMFDF